MLTTNKKILDDYRGDWESARMKSERESPETLPCNGCIACCQGHRRPVVLSPQDDLFSLDYKRSGDRLVLKTKDNGDCIHLGKAGCDVHKNKPVYCRVFDCRDLWKVPPKWRQKINPKVMEAASSLERRIRKKG